MRTARPFPLFALVLLLPAAAFGQIIIQHTGANDPESQGFSLVTPGEAALNPVQDQGIDAWSIRDIRVSGYTFYQNFLHSDMVDGVANSPGWILTAKMRFLEPGIARFGFLTGSSEFLFNLILDTEGKIDLNIRQLSIYTIEEDGTGYHEFSVVYDTLEGTVALWIDGSEKLTGLGGFENSSNSVVTFGHFGSTQTHTHWNEVTLTIIPEPAAAALLAGAGALLAVGILRRRRAKLFAVDPGQRVAG